MVMSCFETDDAVVEWMERSCNNVTNYEGLTLLTLDEFGFVNQKLGFEVLFTGFAASSDYALAFFFIVVENVTSNVPSKVRSYLQGTSLEYLYF